MNRLNVDDMQSRLRQMIQELGDTDCAHAGNDLSDLMSDYSGFSDDMLSCVSDVSSVASFAIEPLKNSSFNSKGSSKYRHNYQTKPNTKQSHIPVPVKNSNKKTDAKNKQNKNMPGIKLAKTIKCSSPPPMAMPSNFLAPDLSEYSHACICIFQGTDFPKSQNGERSTYVVVQLHPDLPPVKSPISFNRTTNAVYNGGFDQNIIAINFFNVVPIVEVYDFISEDQNELLGIAFIPLHMARHSNDVCVALQDEWIDVYTVNTRIRCGKVKMTLIFHNETDISQFVNKDSFVTHPQIVRQQRAKQIEEEKPVREEMAIQTDVKIKDDVNSSIDRDDELAFNLNSYLSSGEKSKPMKDFNFNKFETTNPEKVRVNPFSFGPVRSVPIPIPDDEPEDIPIKHKTKASKPEIVFVDENDLCQISDEVFSANIASAKSHKQNPTHQIKQQPAHEKYYRQPLQQIVPNPINNTNQTINPQSSDQKKRRFARYSDFNMH